MTREELRQSFEDTGYISWINADIYPNGKIYTQEYTEWLETKVLNEFNQHNQSPDKLKIPLDVEL